MSLSVLRIVSKNCCFAVLIFTRETRGKKVVTDNIEKGVLNIHHASRRIKIYFIYELLGD